MPPDGEQQTLDPEALATENARLKAELEAARTGMAEETARANAASNEASQAGTRAHAAQVAQLAAQEVAATNTVASIDQEIRGLKTQLSALQAEGKFDEAADIQEKIGDATARRLQAKQAQEYYAGQKTTASAAPADPVEQFIAANQRDLSKEDVDWIRRNRRFAEDSAFRDRVKAGHHEAIQKGIAHRSPEYWQLIERRGYRQADPPPASAGQQPPAAAAADGGNTGAAPSGYTGGNPESDTASGGIELQIIQPQDTTQMQSQNSGGPAFNRQAEVPQARAAGTGSIRAAIAAEPSRAPIGGNGRQVVARLTQEQMDTALAMAPHMAPKEVLEGGAPAIGLWWQTLNNSPTANRIRQGWG